MTGISTLVASALAGGGTKPVPKTGITNRQVNLRLMDKSSTWHSLKGLVQPGCVLTHGQNSQRRERDQQTTHTQGPMTLCTKASRPSSLGHIHVCTPVM